MEDFSTKIAMGTANVGHFDFFFTDKIDRIVEKGLWKFCNKHMVNLTTDCIIED